MRQALELALDALRTAQDYLAPSKANNSELWYKCADAIVSIQEVLAQQERNFCPRCGKRLVDGSIHTCTPPLEGKQ
jgi:uncharacterized paraquat-inducible protein A